MPDLTARHAQIPEAVAARYRRALRALPGWVAEDLVSHLTLALVQAWRRYRPGRGCTFDGYLFTCVVQASKACRARFRYEKRAGTLRERRVPPGWFDRGCRDKGRDALEARDVCEQLRSRLTADQWQALWGRHAEGLTGAQLARALGLRHDTTALELVRDAERAAREVTP